MNEIPLKPYYVYVLADPTSEEVFYVGKGQGVRIYAHSNEAIQKLEDRDKLNKIREITNSGKNIIERVVGRYDLEEEAFAVEATLINWVYGYENLTNLNRGKGSTSIRKLENGLINELDFLDVPRVNIKDGSFTTALEQKNARFNIEERLIAITKQLIEVCPKIFKGTIQAQDISAPDLSRPKDPTFYIIISELARLEFVLRPNSTKISCVLTCIKNNAEAAKNFEIWCERQGIKVSMAGTKKPYFKLDKYLDCEEPKIKSWWKTDDVDLPPDSLDQLLKLTSLSIKQFKQS